MVRRKLEEILNGSVMVGRQDFRRALNLNVNLRGINDHLLVVVAKRLNVPVLSYDSDVITLGKRVGVDIINGFTLDRQFNASLNIMK
ncbi:hypothetical protein [Metallosphaera javensis (ex Sakai et al. 2022)]|uniref:hypothetical protein n=1 Tax=Metallosphaera javensis (ex Sakai et al. 2022) TaxID=2775498 RepID=UPI002585F32E|nr:MAG: hypothetical protein MjAS7_2286 [Metallosphaera javensis (ex Sakai et al. 2022)]